MNSLKKGGGWGHKEWGITPNTSNDKEQTCKKQDYLFNRASLVDKTVKNPPAVEENWLQSLGWEDPLEKGMATHSSILAWIIPWTEEPGWLQSMGLQRVRHNWITNICLFNTLNNCNLLEHVKKKKVFFKYISPDINFLRSSFLF